MCRTELVVTAESASPTLSILRLTVSATTANAFAFLVNALSTYEAELKSEAENARLDGRGDHGIFPESVVEVSRAMLAEVMSVRGADPDDPNSQHPSLQSLKGP